MRKIKLLFVENDEALRGLLAALFMQHLPAAPVRSGRSRGWDGPGRGGFGGGGVGGECPK